MNDILKERDVYIMQLVSKSKKPMTAQAIVDSADPKFNIKKQTIYILTNEGWLESQLPGDTTKGKTYHLSEYGREVLANLDRYEIRAYRPSEKLNERGMPQHRPSQTSLIIEPPAPTLNVSPSTDILMNNISQVIKENSDYRAIMIQSVRDIARALGLRILEEKVYQQLINERKINDDH